MTFLRDLALCPLVAIVPRRCSLRALSLLLGREGESRSGRGLGRPPGGIAAVGAGKQSNQDCKQANHDRHQPRDPHDHKAIRRSQLSPLEYPPRSVANTPAPESDRLPALADPARLGCPLWASKRSSSRALPVAEPNAAGSERRWKACWKGSAPRQCRSRGQATALLLPRIAWSRGCRRRTSYPLWFLAGGGPVERSFSTGMRVCWVADPDSHGQKGEGTPPSGLPGWSARTLEAGHARGTARAHSCRTSLGQHRGT